MNIVTTNLVVSLYLSCAKFVLGVNPSFLEHVVVILDVDKLIQVFM
jgi:hypothetical protein